MPHEIEITVPGWTDASGHTEYIIKTVSAGEHHASVQHRFSSFTELHSVLVTRLAKLPTQFPCAKTVSKASETVKRDRVEKLQNYLRLVVQLSDNAGPPREFLKFLRIDPAWFGLGGAVTGSGGGGGSGGSDIVASESTSFAAFGSAGSFVPERPSNTNEALREAIKAGDTPLCLELVEAKADPNFRDRQGAKRGRPSPRAPAPSPPPPPARWLPTVCVAGPPKSPPPPPHPPPPALQGTRPFTWRAYSTAPTSPRRCWWPAPTSRSRTSRASFPSGWPRSRSR